MASSTTGMLASTAAASIWPNSGLVLAGELGDHEGRRLGVALRVRIMAKKNSFQASMNANTPAANSGGQRDGQDDQPEHLQRAGAVHGGRPLQLPGGWPRRSP